MNLRPKGLVGLARFFGLDSWKALAWVVAGWACIVGLFVVQYGLYGTDRYLGWDTSSYVGLAHTVEVFGPMETLARLGYPSLYVYLDWILGSLASNIGFGERILPVLMGMALVAIYFRLGREVFRGRPLAWAGLTALLAALTPNTMRLMSDLHRNLFALLAVLAAIILLAELAEGKRGRRTVLVLLVVLGALAAYSEIETYAVLLVLVVVYAAFEIRQRWPAVLSTALPLLVAAPFLVPYFQLYVQYAAVRNPADPGISIWDFVYYHGGIEPLLPLAAFGAVVLALRARQGPPLLRLLLGWYVILMALVPALYIYGGNLPPYRALYLVPVPILLVLGIDELKRLVSKAAQWFEARRHEERPTVQDARPARRMGVPAILAILVILATGVGLSAQKDVYMQPFIDQNIYDELVQAGHVLQPYATSTPIVAYAGFNGTWYYGMDQAYLEAFSGPTSGYFGRPQFLLSMTDPLVAEPLLPESPDPSRFVASQLYGGLAGGGLNSTGVTRFAILVATPGLYGRPVSDYFVVKHRVAPGLYLVPPNTVTPLDRDTWMWFAAYDWQTASTFGNSTYPWSLAPRVLQYVTPSLQQTWGLTYFMNLYQATPNATLSLHLLDTPPFPAAWNIPVGGSGNFTVSVDNVTVAQYAYGYGGATWVNLTLGELTAGYHTVRVQARDLGRPFAIALDALAYCPNGIDLPTVLSAYSG